MAISQETYKQMLVDELDITEYPDVLTTVNNYWEMNNGSSDKETFLKTKVSLCVWLLGRLRRKKDITIGKDSAKSSQEVANVNRILAQAEQSLKSEFPYSSVPSIESIPLTSNLPSSGEDIYTELKDRYALYER